MQHDLGRSVLLRTERPRFLRLRNVEELALPRVQAAVNSRRDRQGRHARRNAVQIDLHGLGRLFLLLLFLGFFFLLLVFRLGISFLVVALLVFFVFLILIFIFVGFFFVAFRLEGRSLVGFQRQCEDAVGAVVVEALVELANAGEKVALREEEKIPAFAVEDGIRVVVKTIRDLGRLFLIERIEEQLAGAAAVGFRVSDPLAVRCPTAIGDVSVIALIDLDGPFFFR